MRGRPPNVPRKARVTVYLEPQIVQILDSIQGNCRLRREFPTPTRSQIVELLIAYAGNQLDGGSCEPSDLRAALVETRDQVTARE